MWVGAGLWHDTDFYTAFEASHGAVFVWSMYLAFGPDGYIRYGLEDPMAALASRTAGFNEYLHNPPWAAEWIVEQARAHRIDGALVLRPRSMKPAATGRLFIERALEDGGIPGTADRGGCRGRSRVGSRGNPDGCANVSRHAGARMTTIAAARVWPTAWMLPFAVTLVAMFALQLSNLGFSPLLPSIQQEFAMSYTQLGTFTGIYGLLAMVLSVPAGVSARRFGEKRVLALGLLGVAAGSLLLGQAWSVESAIGFRALTIFGYRFAFVSVLIAVALTAPPALRGRTMGIVGATSSLASVIGAPLGGTLVREFTWRTAILGYAGMAALGAVVFWLCYRPGPDADPAHATPHDTGPRISALTSPVVWMLALIVGLGGFGQFTVTYFVPSVASSVYGLDAAAAGIIISTGYMTAIAVNLLVGLLADRYNKLLVLAGLFVLLAARPPR